MSQLRVLGRIELIDREGDPVHSVLNQPKRIAFLAYLAVAADAAAPREALVELFWPDVDREKGRHSLSQCVYCLRRALGKDALLRRGSMEVGLSNDHVWTDVRAFREAVEAERWEAALDLYRGDFLEGLSHPDLRELQRWVDEQRSQLRERAAWAASAVAERLAGAGDPAAACDWARRAVELKPYEERPVRDLMELLCRAGDRAKALAEYRRFEEDLSRSLGAEPSKETVALAVAIQESALGPKDGKGLGPRIARPRAEAADLPASGAETDIGTVPLRGRSVAPAVPTSWNPGDERRTRGLGRGVRSGLRRVGRGTGPVRIGAALLILGAALLWLPRTSETVPQESRIAVFPFRFQGSERYEYLAAGLAELLTISLRGLDQLQTVDPLTLFSATSTGGFGVVGAAEARELARRFGAEYYVTGTSLEAGGRIQVTATVHSVERGVVGSLHRRIEDEGRIFNLVDDLVRGFIAEGYLIQTAPLARTAAMATGSLPALRAFLQGEALFRTGHHHRALQFLREAMELDPSFAYAHYRAAVVSLWTGSDDFDAARTWNRGALAEADRLPERDRLLIRAMDAFLQGDGRRAERLYREALAIQPENLEAWLHLGEVLYHYGPVTGRDVVHSRHAWERVLALDPLQRSGLTHLAAIAAAAGDPAELERMVGRLRELDEGPGVPVHVLALHASVTGDAAARAQLLERLRGEPVRIVRQAASYVALYLYDLEFASAIAGTLTDPAQASSERTEGHLWLAHLHLASGRLERAEQEFALAGRLDPERAGLERRMLSVIPEAPTELWALAEAGDRRWTEDPPGVPVVVDIAPRPSVNEDGEFLPGPSSSEVFSHFHTYVDGLLSSPGQESWEGLGTAAARLEAAAHEDAGIRPLAVALRAEEDLRRGRVERATEGLLRAMDEVGFWYERIRQTPLHSLARERFLLAELLVQEGELEDAMRWYDSLVRSSLGEIAYLAPSRFRLGELSHALGDPETARRHYDHLVQLWEDADPELQPVVAEARARLAHLEAATRP